MKKRYFIIMIVCAGVTVLYISLSMLLINDSYDDGTEESVLIEPEHDAQSDATEWTPDENINVAAVSEETDVDGTDELQNQTATGNISRHDGADDVKASYDNDDLVKISDFDSNIVVDMRYATKDNFTGKIIYDFSDAYIRYGTMKKILSVQEALEKKGLGLKIWDAYRPPAAQYTLWDVTPDRRYVANPNNGYSSHSRGNTLDLTIVTIDGEEVTMPTGFDDFTSKADRDYSDCSEIERKNAIELETVMRQNGFHGYYAEWWHYTDDDAYDVYTDEEFTGAVEPCSYGRWVSH